MDVQRVKKNLFNTAMAEGLIKLEPISPDKFYGKTYGKTQSPSRACNYAQTNIKDSPERTHGLAIHRPKEMKNESIQTGCSRRTSDELSTNFFAEFVSAFCGNE